MCLVRSVVQLSVLITMVGFAGSVCGQTRPAQFQDFFRFQSLKDATLSLDGSLVAYTLERSFDSSNKTNPYPYLQVPGYGRVRGDIWVGSTSGGFPERITDGATDGAWFWGPMWSPNSDKLMMLL